MTTGKAHPRQFRETFAVEMLQTFADRYAEARQGGGLALVTFWAVFLVDDFRNVIIQHRIELAEANATVTVPRVQLLLAAVLAIPLSLGCVGITVPLAIALPHPPLSGIFVPIILALVLVMVPAVIGGALSWCVAGLVLRALPKRAGRVAPAP